MDQPPLAQWGARDDLAMVIAGITPPWDDEEFSTQEGGDGFNPTGVSDFQTQVVLAIDQSDQINRSTHWIAMGWMVFLAIVVGPLDYYLLNYVIKKPQLTWFTLPIWLALIVYWTTSSARATNTQPLTTRQIDVVDVDTTVDEIRCKSWMNFYSPATRRYSIKASLAVPELENLLPPQFIMTSWAERPESGYRGMYRPGGRDSSKASYEITPNHQQINNLPVRIWSTRTVNTEWEMPVESSQLVRSDLVDNGSGRLKGEIQNLLPIDLHDWFLAYGGFAYFPREDGTAASVPLERQATFVLDEGRSNILRGYLLRLQGTTTKGRLKSSRDAQFNREDYDVLSRNAYDIFRILSFHEITGGIEFSTLSNQSLPELDLSTHVDLGRAVLFGRVDEPVTTFEIDGDLPPAENHETLVRIILPVRIQKRSTSAPPDPELLKTP